MTAESEVISKETDDFPESVVSLMKMRNNMGPKTVPCETPTMTRRGDERVPLRETSWLCEERRSVIQEWSWP